MYYTIAAIILLVILLFILYKLYEINQNITVKSNLVINKPKANIKYETEKIPKIIIQTWKTNSVPQRYMPLIESIKTNNPDYEYLFFTDNDIENFLKANYSEYYQTYLNLPIKIQRIDFFRYVAIYHFGGFYMDLDMLCLKSFDDLLKYNCVFPIDEFISKDMCKMRRYKPFCDNGYYYLLGQYAFAAGPKHPFIKVIIDKIHTNINKYIKYVNFDSEDYVYKTTGPDYVTDLYINYKDKDDILVINNGRRQYFGDYAKHNYFGTWK
jgi:mannosyltransferase OCH1-like enzyme